MRRGCPCLLRLRILVGVFVGCLVLVLALDDLDDLFVDVVGLAHLRLRKDARTESVWCSSRGRWLRTTLSTLRPCSPTGKLNTHANSNAKTRRLAACMVGTPVFECAVEERKSREHLPAKKVRGKA